MIKLFYVYITFESWQALYPIGSIFDLVWIDRMHNKWINQWKVGLKGIKSQSPCTSSLANMDWFKSACNIRQLLLEDKSVYLNSIHIFMLVNNLIIATNAHFSYSPLRLQHSFWSWDHPQGVNIQQAYIKNRLSYRLKCFSP